MKKNPKKRRKAVETRRTGTEIEEQKNAESSDGNATVSEADLRWLLRRIMLYARMHGQGGTE